MDGLVGKSFDLSGPEVEVLELRNARALELQAQAQQLMAASRAERQGALERVRSFALERVGAPPQSDVEWKVVDGVPKSFTITKVSRPAPKKEEPPPPCEGKDCGEDCPEGCDEKKAEKKSPKKPARPFGRR